MEKALERWKISEDASALLGAAAAFLSFDDCKLILHSPMWCASITERELTRKRPDWEGRIFATFVNETDLLFGGKEKLQLAVKDADICPKDLLLGVAVNCGPGIAGDDIEGICRKACGIPVAVAEAGGFSGEFADGWAKGMIAIFKAMAPEATEKISDSVNLLGSSACDERERAELADCIRQLESKRIRVNAVLGAAENSLKILRQWRRAEKNIVLHPRGIPVAQWLWEEWGEPWIVWKRGFGKEFLK